MILQVWRMSRRTFFDRVERVRGERRRGDAAGHGEVVGARAGPRRPQARHPGPCRVRRLPSQIQAGADVA